jgi:hypothetical protein
MVALVSSPQLIAIAMITAGTVIASPAAVAQRRGPFRRLG